VHADNFFLNTNEVALVIVDIQERLAAVMGERQKVIDNCLHLITAAGLFRIPMIITEQYPKGLGPTVKEIRDASEASDVIEKIDFSCCNEPGFLDTLASTGRRKIVLTGMETHVCVLQTCLGLLREGYIVHIARDAVCSRKKEDYKTGIEFLRNAGAVITCTETILFQLLEKAGTEEFKIISKRIK
jgi:nicotinamidase-related amidase